MLAFLQTEPFAAQGSFSLAQTSAGFPAEPF